MEYIKPTFIALLIGLAVQLAFHMMAKNYVAAGAVVHWDSFLAVGIFVWLGVFTVMTRDRKSLAGT